MIATISALVCLVLGLIYGYSRGPSSLDSDRYQNPNAAVTSPEATPRQLIMKKLSAIGGPPVVRNTAPPSAPAAITGGINYQQR